MEQIASATGEAKAEEASKLVRFWRMLQTVHHGRYIKRKDLDGEVFG